MKETYIKENTNKTVLTEQTCFGRYLMYLNDKTDLYSRKI